MRATLRK